MSSVGVAILFLFGVEGELFDRILRGQKSLQVGMGDMVEIDQLVPLWSDHSVQ